MIPISFIQKHFPKGKFSLLSGTPGSGKTAFALLVALSLAKMGKRVYYFSLDDKTKILARRILPKCFMDYPEVCFYNLIIEYVPEVTILKLKKSLKATPVDFVVVDYIQCLPMDKTSRVDSLKQMASEFGVPVLGLARSPWEWNELQRNREIPGPIHEEVYKYPGLSDVSCAALYRHRQPFWSKSFLKWESDKVEFVTYEGSERCVTPLRLNSFGTMDGLIDSECKGLGEEISYASRCYDTELMRYYPIEEKYRRCYEWEIDWAKEEYARVQRGILEQPFEAVTNDLSEHRFESLFKEVIRQYNDSQFAGRRINFLVLIEVSRVRSELTIDEQKSINDGIRNLFGDLSCRVRLGLNFRQGRESRLRVDISDYKRTEEEVEEIVDNILSQLGKPTI